MLIARYQPASLAKQCGVMIRAPQRCIFLLSVIPKQHEKLSHFIALL